MTAYLLPRTPCDTVSKQVRGWAAKSLLRIYRSPHPREAGPPNLRLLQLGPDPLRTREHSAFGQPDGGTVILMAESLNAGGSSP